MPTILVTGATGFLGRELLGTLLTADDAIRVVALVRAADEVAFDRRADDLLRRVPAAHRGRVDTVRGDVTLPDLGLDRSGYEGLLGGIDRVLHVAATTRFDHDL